MGVNICWTFPAKPCRERTRDPVPAGRILEAFLSNEVLGGEKWRGDLTAMRRRVWRY
jgi:hypothetical protein